MRSWSAYCSPDRHAAMSRGSAWVWYCATSPASAQDVACRRRTCAANAACSGWSTKRRGARRRFGTRSIGCRNWTSPSTCAPKPFSAARSRRPRRAALDGRQPSLPGDRAGLRTIGADADGDARTRAVSRDRDRARSRRWSTPETLAAFYSRIGIKTGDSRGDGRSKQKRRPRQDCARAGSFSPARGTAMELEAHRLPHPGGIQGDAGAPADAGAGDAALGAGSTRPAGA